MRIIVEDKQFKQISDLWRMDHNFETILSNYIIGKEERNLLEFLEEMISKNKPQLLRTYKNFLKIANEMKTYGVDSLDIGKKENWGIKNNHLAVFDIGWGDTDEEIKNINLLEVNDKQIPELALKILERIKQHLKITNYSYIGGGGNGFAFEIPANKVLKITSDRNEASNCFKIKGKHLDYIADVYETYHIKYEGKNYFIIILEKLDTINTLQYQKDFDAIDDYVYTIWKKANNVI